MRLKKFLGDFKAFAVQGNVINLAVGVMIGGAFSKIITSLVSDIFTPILSLVTGCIDFGGLFIALDGGQYTTAQEAARNGAGTLNYGAFLTNVIDFLLIALCIFMFVRLIGKILPKKPEPPKPKMRQCPYCVTEIQAAAVRCPNCTSTLEPEAESPQGGLS